MFKCIFSIYLYLFILYILYIFTHIFIHSFTDGHLDCFYILGIMNKLQ